MSISASPDRPSEQNEPLTRRRKADFRLLWSATTVSQAGTQVSELAIPLAAILTLHAGALQVGVLAALGYLPALLFGLPAGAWADRLPRRVIMIIADLARLAVLASVPVAYALHGLSLGQLYAVAFCVGALSVFFDVASPAYLPSLVPRVELAKANGRLQISEQSAAVFGPGLAGWLVGLIGAPVAIAVDTCALTFTISNATWRQLVTPDEMLGRVTAAMRLLTWAAQPLAALLAGWLGGQFGLHAALWVGAAGVLLAPIPLLTARLTAEPLGPQPVDAPAT